MVTEVSARPAPGREVAFDSFADLTETEVIGVDWVADGFLRVAFDGVLDDTEAAAVRRRLVSATEAEEQLRAECEAYLLHDTTPGPDELHQQLVRLTLLMTKVV